MSRPDQVRPQITQLYGIPIPTKRRALILQQGQVATVQFQFLDGTGNPVDLTPYSTCGSQGPQGPQGSQDCTWNVVVRMREVIGIDSKGVLSADCDIVDAESGIISFEPPTFAANNAGVYTAEFAVFHSSDSLPAATLTSSMAFSNKAYVWVDRGLFGDPQCPNLGPPTMDEIRMFVRDNGPEENLLLDDFEFDLAEICQGTENAVRYWNEVNPPIGIYFSTITYCVRHKWLQAIAGHMLTAAAHRFRRNHLPYQAGGISIDDQNKFQQYDQSGMMLTQEYKDWVKTKKVEINCYMAMTSSGSPYGSAAYSLLNTGV